MPTTTNTTTRHNPVALVTGGTTGIGLEACQQLAAKGIDIILTSRSAAKGQAAVETIQRQNKANANVRFVIMELSDLSSVEKACDSILKEEPRLDFLLLNAGVMGNASEMETTDIGIEAIVAVNHVAGYYIAHKLLPLMEKTAAAAKELSNDKTKQHQPPTITFVSSDLHNIHSPTGAAKTLKPIVKDETVRYCSQQGVSGLDASAARDHNQELSYHPTYQYKFSKLLNVLTMQAVHERLLKSQSSVQCNSMEPGFIPESDLSREVKAKLGNFLGRLLVWNLYHGPINWLISYVLGQPVRTLKEGGASEVYALTQGKAGKYYRLDQVDPPSPLCQESEVADGFYQATANLLKEKGFPVATL